jgi:c-di-GMP-binding flagellar brake protein YcgR
MESAASPQTPSPDDRRLRYRVTPETIEGLRVSIILQPGVEAVAELLDASTGGVGVRLPHLSREELIHGQKVLVQITSDLLNEPIRLAGQVVQVRFGSDTPLEAGIAFVNWARRDHNLAPLFLRLFNQRRCFRVTPSLEDQEKFRLVLRPVGGNRSVRSWLADISATGLGLWLPSAKVYTTETVMTGGAKRMRHQLKFGPKVPLGSVGDIVNLKIEMPGLAEVFTLPCTIRHIEAWSGAPRARMGLEMPVQRLIPRSLHTAIQHYITERQRHMRQVEAEDRRRRALDARPVEANGAALKVKR